MATLVKQFISDHDRAKLDAAAADKAVKDSGDQLTADQKAQVEAQAALDDSTAQLSAVVSAYPDGVITADGRFLEVVRGSGLKESTPRHDDQVQGDLTKNPDGSYSFNPVDAPAPDPTPEPAPAPAIDDHPDVHIEPDHSEPTA